MRLTRRYRFSASHRLHSDALSSEQNAELYGKCNNPYGHGHDYILEISVRGEPDLTTGRLVSPGLLDKYISEHVLDIYDHRDMTLDIPEMVGTVATTENLAVDVERRLRSGWSENFAGVELDRVMVQETPNNIFELRNL